MHHSAGSLKILEGTVLEVSFKNGIVKQYDVSLLFDEYPQLTALQDRKVFESGRLLGSSGIYWSDELDIDAETVYNDGVTVREGPGDIRVIAGEALAGARLNKGMTQSELAKASGVDQSDISRIECGEANPSVRTLQRLADGMSLKLKIEFRPLRK